MAQAAKSTGRRSSNTSSRSSKGKASRSAAPDPAAAPAAAAKQAAVAGTKAAGMAVTSAASKLKVPLIVGASAVAGIAGGAALKERLDHRGRRFGRRKR